MDKDILKQFKSNIALEEQVDLLAHYLMKNFEGAFRNGEGAIEMAVRLLEEYRNAQPINNLL